MWLIREFRFIFSGLVVGLLKIGRKSLYVFDKLGETRHVNAPSVLDFYIHESRQRGGLGKILFEYMLEFENLLPEQLAIDRPSDKLLGFLRKHYALTQKIPQMNNFVIYDGFFAPEQSQNVNGGPVHISARWVSRWFISFCATNFQLHLYLIIDIFLLIHTKSTNT